MRGFMAFFVVAREQAHHPARGRRELVKGVELKQKTDENSWHGLYSSLPVSRSHSAMIQRQPPRLLVAQSVK